MPGFNEDFFKVGQQLKEFKRARMAQQKAQEEAQYKNMCDEYGFVENEVTKLCYQAAKQQENGNMNLKEWFQYFVEFSIMLENARGK